MNGNEVIQRLDEADLFLRNRANAAPAPLNEYDTCIMLDAAETCNEAAALIDRQRAQIERLKKDNKILSVNADTAFQDGLNENRDLFKKEVEPEIRTKTINEFVTELKRGVPQETGVIKCKDVDEIVKRLTEVCK